MSEHDHNGWWYLSFAGDTFRGGCIVAGDGFLGAVRESHRQGCNPGGECLGFPVLEGKLPGPQCRNVLLTKEDVLRIWPGSRSLGEWEDLNGKVTPPGHLDEAGAS